MKAQGLLDASFWLPTAVAVFCGTLLGLERQLRGKPAGIRTSILICLGTAVFIRIGAILAVHGGDPSRTLGQVVTGVGFLGGGVILTHGGHIRGMTSAAVIWLLACVGSLIGLGYFAQAIALTLVTLLVLIGVEWLEHTFRQLRRGVHAEEGTEAEDAP